MEGRIAFEGLQAFDMNIRYVEDAVGVPDRLSEHHIHGECEIYIHLSGDVSFMVEDQLYPVQYGNVVITRPYEYHHCIYHTKTKHRHFWILFSGESNQHLLEMFFGRRKGSGNLLALDTEAMQEMVSLCFALCDSSHSKIEKYFFFFQMLRLLERAEIIVGDEMDSKQEMLSVLSAVHRRYSEKLSVRQLAEEAHISVSTLERWFEENLRMTPTAYIRKIRLANAARLLSKQCSVTETADLCGFSDVSAMIGMFKKQYGVTPFQYKKQMK